MQPKQNPKDYRAELCELLNRHLASRGWSPAMLAKKSGQSKATISRMTNYVYCGKPHKPTMSTIQAISLALELSPEESRKLFYTAFPEFFVWEEASEKGYNVIDTNELLEKKGLPLLMRIRK